MLRFDVSGSQAPAVAGSGADNAFVYAVLAHQLLRFYAVLFGIQLKIQVVQQAYYAPVFLLVCIAKLLGKVTHNTFYSKSVTQVKGFLVILT